MEERRRLPQLLEYCNKTKALTLLECIRKDVAKPRSSGPAVPHLTTLHRYSVHLRQNTTELARRNVVAGSVLDPWLKSELEASGSLNWCEQGAGLYALKNAERNNCLMDAVSMGMWGIRDRDLVLRTAVFTTMAVGNPADLCLLEHNAWRYKSQHEPSSEEWGRMVRLVDPETGHGDSVDNPYQHVHLFLLANIIRRPIIVLGAASTEKMEVEGSSPGPLGIYLPLMWEGKDCHPYPVVLGSRYPWRYFAPLVTMGSTAEQALPLVQRGPGHKWTNLPLRFAPDLDEQQCLDAYLKMTALLLEQQTVRATRIKGHNLPDHLNLVVDYFMLVNQACGKVSQETEEALVHHTERQNRPPPHWCSSSPPSLTAFSITQDMCATEQCPYFSSKFTWPYCHQCLQSQPWRSSGPEGRKYSSLGDASFRRAPVRFQLPQGPSSAPSAPSRHTFRLDRNTHNAPELQKLQQPQQTNSEPRQSGTVPAGWNAPGTTWSECAQAVDSDFLCGRCLACKQETRTFNGLCFQCLRSHTEVPPLTSPGPRETTDSSGERCLTPGCVYFSSHNRSGYCSYCSCSKGRVPAMRPPSSSSSSSTSLQLSSTLRNLPRCSTAGCDMLGNPAFRGLCERCHLSLC